MEFDGLPWIMHSLNLTRRKRKEEWERAPLVRDLFPGGFDLGRFLELLKLPPGVSPKRIEGIWD